MNAERSPSSVPKQPPLSLVVDGLPTKPDTCEWCRELPPTQKRSIGASKNMPGQDAVLHLCGRCAIRVDNQKAQTEQERANERARKKVYGR